MTLLNYMAASILALSLAACGKAQDTARPETSVAETPADMPGENMVMDSNVHNMSAMGEGIGHAIGTIRSVGGNSDFLTIEHGPFDGIDMGAMTMGFDVLSDVDVSGFAKGDAVAFMVKQGRDGSYRITSICNTGTDGADCLDKPSAQ